MVQLKDKKAVVIGTYLAMMTKAYLNENNMAVISYDENTHILPPQIPIIKNDVSKKANLAINILLNALDHKFDVAHDYKV